MKKHFPLALVIGLLAAGNLFMITTPQAGTPDARSYAASLELEKDKLRHFKMTGAPCGRKDRTVWFGRGEILVVRTESANRMAKGVENAYFEGGTIRFIRAEYRAWGKEVFYELARNGSELSLVTYLVDGVPEQPEYDLVKSASRDMKLEYEACEAARDEPRLRRYRPFQRHRIEVSTPLDKPN